MGYSMKTSRCVAIMIILLVSAFFFLTLSPSAARGKVKRGDAPQCQQQCLARHSEKMAKLSEEYAGTLNKTKYQDEVELEIGEYSRCLTECRDVIPVK